MPRKMDRERHNVGESKLLQAPAIGEEDDPFFNRMRCSSEEACDELLLRLIKYHGIDGRPDIYPGIKRR